MKTIDLQEPVHYCYRKSVHFRAAAAPHAAVLLPGLTQQDVIVADVVSTLCRTPNANDGFYFELNQAETQKRNTYRMYGITLHHFFPLAFGRTNILSRETLRFCGFVGNYFPKSLKVADRLRATFSRSIAAGVAATFNMVVRRLQLASANAVAFSMIPPMPTSRSAFNNTRAQLSKTYASLNRVSPGDLAALFSDIVSRDSGHGPPVGVVRSCDSEHP